ncbi:TetR/AcrR family transcriptional regulator [Specibacter sp. AOP5-B1-6]|uniref:TetR/AcrR family transcriptional regulator n=1 Tax=Specibacter sp. AOP5-B1-6 TaxID=3457653 RepID=UPI003FB9B5C0
MDVLKDRRQLRRQATIEEILAAAVKLMARDGVAGMSLSGVARAVGMKPPSLYEYFPSKMALYDALFAQGSAELAAAVRAAGYSTGTDPLTALLAGARAYVGWLVRHPVSAQLLVWRPVPGFEPSPQAFAPSVDLMAETRALLVLAVERGRLLPAAATDDAVLLFTSVIAGVVSQQLANEPLGGAESGRYTRLMDPAMAMWLAQYTP